MVFTSLEMRKRYIVIDTTALLIVPICWLHKSRAIET